MSDALSTQHDEGRSTPVPGEAAPPGDEITVLVVDDEPSNQTSLAKIFQREGMRVFTADGAKSALEVARKHKVQVVLSDLMMPGTNGVELMRALKEVSPDTETVLMTAYCTVETAVQAMRDGGTVAMVMPNNPYRCPPGPYERACMIAHYLKTKKPKSKLVILDPKKSFSKQSVITEAFEKYYKGIIELNLSTEIDDFSVLSIEPKTKEIVTNAGSKVRADVASIPAEIRIAAAARQIAKRAP